VPDISIFGRIPPHAVAFSGFFINRLLKNIKKCHFETMVEKSGFIKPCFLQSLVVLSFSAAC